MSPAPQAGAEVPSARGGELLAWVTQLSRRSLALPLAALAILVVFIINEVTYHRSRESLAASEFDTQTRIKIQTVLRLLLDAETGKRGYLLTGRREYLEPYHLAVGGAMRTLEELTAIYADDPRAAATMQELNSKGREKLSELATTLDLYEQGRSEAWRDLLLTDIGREKMEAVRVAAEKLFELQNERVTELRDSLFTNFQITRVGVDLMAALGMIALVLLLRQGAALDQVRKSHAQSLEAERLRLEDEVAHRTGELTELARHLQTAREDERARLARELHDELGALLTAAKLDAARLKRSLGPMASDVEERLQHLNASIDRGIALKRDIIENLRPSSLSNLGLHAALDIQAREFAKRADIRVTTQLAEVTLADSAQITIYRLVQESLTNIAKHAGATEITVTLARDGAKVVVGVRDNGCGFDTQRTRPSAHGLLGMRFRVEAAGGAMQVASTPGQGTTVEAWLPV